jgi:hypothetical protein
LGHASSFISSQFLRLDQKDLFIAEYSESQCKSNFGLQPDTILVFKKLQTEIKQEPEL